MSNLNLNQKLIIKNNKKLIYQTANTQVLYLYPLTLKDYVDNLKYLLPIKIDIIKIDKDLDYNIYFNNAYFKRLKCVEITVDKSKDINTIKSLIKVLKNKRLKVSLNMKDMVQVPLSFFKEVTKDISYFKIYWNYINLDKFKKRLDLINKYKNETALVHIKGYLRLEEIDNYEEYIKIFNQHGVDIYQLSKELLPLDKENVIIDDKYEKKIRELEDKYKDEIIFKSVKNLKELYYPRFELDERNSKNCYACKLKPYLYKDILLPCKVFKMINNIEEWGIKDLNNLIILNRCGKECDDCASIYENDILDEINIIIKENSKVKIYMERDDKV